jgi:hypothetical protein
MSEFDLLFWAMVAAIVALGVAVASLAIGQARLREASRRDAQRLFEQMDLTLGELRDVSTALSGCLQGVQELRVRGTSAQRAAASAPAPAPSRSYDIALRLARNGASREELMSSCGMSRHEAELAVRLHGPEQRGRPLRAGAAA